MLVTAGILLVLLCLRLWLKRKHLPRKAARRDRRESIWSWDLFWAQLRQVLRHLFSHLGRRTQRKGGQDVEKRSALAADLGLPSTARDVREIYRLLLAWCTTHGYPRLENETPHEFERRLVLQFPGAQAHLTIITGAYVASRYGAASHGEQEVTRLQSEWRALLTLWQEINGATRNERKPGATGVRAYPRK